MSGPAALLLAAGLGYVAGSIPFGFLTARYIAGVDVRSQGSGKIGATNVRRLLGWKGFFLVMALDLLKGTAAVFAAGLLVDGGVEPWVKAAAGVGAIAGHSWPVFLRFKGGRGVATGMGAMAVMLPLVVVLAVLVALPLIMMSRYMSLGSLIGAVLVGVVTLGEVLLNDQPWAYFCYAALGSGLIVIKHRDNIERILSGTERRL